MRQFVVLALFISFAFTRLAPLLRKVEPHRIHDSYIIVFKETVGITRQAEIKQLAAKFHPTHNISFEYTIIPGFAAHLTKEGVAYLQTLDEVDYIEEDQLAYATCTTQNNAVWNLARTSTQGGPNWSANEYRSETNGSGVEAFILDTGILLTHNEFSGRARMGANFLPIENEDDWNGHGTHVASIVAGTTYGVAKGATVVAVKVLGSDGSGSISGIIAGINWVAQNAEPNKDTANMAFWASGTSSLDLATNNVVSNGIFVAAAAGNNNMDACNISPARLPNVFTVGGTEQPEQGSTMDQLTIWSNYGTCVKAFAPGESIMGAWIGSNSATNTLSGSSFCTPHACGLASIVLGRQSQSPSSVREYLINNANHGTISNPKGSPNVVLFNSCNP